MRLRIVLAASIVAAVSLPFASAEASAAVTTNVTSFGGASALGAGDAGALAVTDLAPTPTAAGIGWRARRGSGPAREASSTYGSMADGLNAPIIAISATPAGGLLLLGRDGGIFSFGDAAFYGSMGAVRLNGPIIDLAPTPTGHGYWLLGRDGGIFSFGDARFFGSAADANETFTSIAVSEGGDGYWLIAENGDVRHFGDAAHVAPSRRWAQLGASLRAPCSERVLGLLVRRGVFSMGGAPFLAAPPCAPARDASGTRGVRWAWSRLLDRGLVAAYQSVSPASPRLGQCAALCTRTG